MGETIKLHRNCKATVIPGGEQFTLEQGAEVEMMQSLGGSYTVMTHTGHLVRIDGQDADALGKAVQRPPTAEEAKDVPLEKLVWDQLKTCYDPEIPIDIANLGLIYKCDIASHPTGEGHSVYIQMTLTAPGCGMGGVLAQDVQGKIERLPGVKEVKVDLVWDPPWNTNMMSDAAKLKLGML